MTRHVRLRKPCVRTHSTQGAASLGIPPPLVHTSVVKQRRDFSVPLGTAALHSQVVGAHGGLPAGEMLRARHIFMGATGPRTAPLTCSAFGGRASSRKRGLGRPPRPARVRRCSAAYATASSREYRFRRNRSRSNGSPVFMMRKRTGTSFLAIAATAFVRLRPLRSSMRW